MTTRRTLWGLVAALAGIALLLGGVATASNMGFKFVPQIPGTVNANAYNLSLPWNNNYTNADSILKDVPGLQRVARMEPNAKFTSWTGSAGTNFPVVKGTAYVVVGSGSGQTPVIVGSHDPNFTFAFVNGANNLSAPYHQTFTGADGLLKDLRSKLGGDTVITRVARIEPNMKLTSWTGSAGTNFPLELGKGVVVYANGTPSGYVWPHY